MSTTPAGRRRPAVIVNPTKLPTKGDPRATITAAMTAAGWDEPMWIETSEDDPGFGQTKEALDRGADLVCALGGDGTVRVVGSALVDTGVPLGILPGGTGNLLARQLDLPIDTLENALDVIVGGHDAAIDVGEMRLRRANGEEEQHHFLVISGVGFDAKIMADAPEELKKRVGWMAYTLSGLRNIPGKRVKARIRYDDAAPVGRRMRSVMIANCGRLQGGVELVPEASVADGELDAVVLSPVGLIGWAGLAAAIATKNHKGHRRMEHTACRTVEVALDNPISCELDGDPVGSVVGFRAEVLPGALQLRLARDGVQPH